VGKRVDQKEFCGPFGHCEKGGGGRQICRGTLYKRVAGGRKKCFPFSVVGTKRESLFTSRGGGELGGGGWIEGARLGKKTEGGGRSLFFWRAIARWAWGGGFQQG